MLINEQACVADQCMLISFNVISRGGLRLLGAPGWNLERGPISNEEEGGKRIFWDYLRILFIPMWDIRPHILGLGPLNGGGPWL